MTKEERKEIIEEMLSKLKQAVASPIYYPDYEFIFDDDTTQPFFDKYECTRQELKDNYISNFTVENYNKGPEDDDDPTKPGNVWVFGFTFQYKALCLEVYIKFREIGNVFYCFKLHKSKWSMDYLYQGVMKGGQND